MSVNSFENYPLSWRPRLNKNEDKMGLSTALAKLLEQDILKGKLLPGTKLPPQRELADYLEIGVSTVTRAFRICRQRGLLSSVVGSGTFVATDATENSVLLSNTDEHPLIDLGTSTTALQLNSLIADSLKELVNEPEMEKLLRYDVAGGSWMSREAGARWMEQCGLPGRSERILVAAGAQNALAACVMGLFQPGDKLAVPAVVYQGIRNAARIMQLQLEPLPEEIPDTEMLAEFLRRERIKGVFVTPDYHNPTARIMPLSERTFFAEAAQRCGVILLEDGSNTMLMRTPQRPIAAVAPEQTIYIAGLSKVLAPGLRGAFIDCPPRFHSRLKETLYALNVTPSPLLFQVINRMIFSGKARDLAEARKKDLLVRNAVIDRILKDCPCRVEGDAGSPVRWLRLSFHPPASLEVLARRADVQVYGAEHFTVGKPTDSEAVRLSVTAPITLQDLEEGVTRLRDLILRLGKEE